MESRQTIYRNADGTIFAKYAEQGKLGRYPQKLVKDKNLIAQLNELVLGRKFQSFGYLCEDGPSFDELAVDFVDGGKTKLEDVFKDHSKAAESMSYIDVEVNGKKYRGVRIQNYRYRSWTKRSGFALNQTYWFLFAPIAWLVQKEDEESLTLSPLCALDSEPFDLENGTDYKTSSIRKWLNGYFLNLAFDKRERAIILDTDLGDGVIDKVYLPLFGEIAMETGEEGERLQPGKSYTGYASINGAYTVDPYADYWLREASYSGGVSVINIYNYRVCLSDKAGRDASVCVAPFIRVKKDAFRDLNPMEEKR